MLHVPFRIAIALLLLSPLPGCPNAAPPSTGTGSGLPGTGPSWGATVAITGAAIAPANQLATVAPLAPGSVAGLATVAPLTTVAPLATVAPWFIQAARPSVDLGAMAFVPGATVSVLGHDMRPRTDIPSVRTDDRGLFKLDLPRNVPLFIQIEQGSGKVLRLKTFVRATPGLANQALLVNVPSTMVAALAARQPDARRLNLTWATLSKVQSDLVDGLDPDEIPDLGDDADIEDQLAEELAEDADLDDPFEALSLEDLDDEELDDEPIYDEDDWDIDPES